MSEDPNYISEYNGVKLLFCPVCGSTDKLEIYEHECYDKHGFDLIIYGVACGNCHSIGPLRDTQEEGVEHWNLGLLRGSYDTLDGWLLYPVRLKGGKYEHNVSIALPVCKPLKSITIGPMDLKEVKQPTVH